jgi:hypothetical protein
MLRTNQSRVLRRCQNGSYSQSSLEMPLKGQLRHLLAMTTIKTRLLTSVVVVVVTLPMLTLPISNALIASEISMRKLQ